MDPDIILRCEDVAKEYRAANGRLSRALRGVSLAVRRGEFLTIVGSSGSGKSTLLRLLADIERPTAGIVDRIDGGSARRVGMVFQNNSVFPWRTVEGNLSYSLASRRVPRATRAERAAELCRAVGLSPEAFLQKYPRELSGGETRRVAIGMALSADAPLMLLDEPTSQLDYVSRLQLQETVHRLWLAEHPTIVYVTHDIEEAVFLGERILVLRDGELVETLVVDLPIPRHREMVNEERALALRKRILTYLGG